MKTAFVTGGTGFIGSRLIALLVERGVRVRALARSQAGLEKVKALGAEPVQGDVIDPASLKDAMCGCDVVFHVASMYEVGLRYKAQMEKVNVDGVRNVIEAAWKAGVPKIVFTSTIGVFGDTRGKLVDEIYEYKGQFSTVYERTKWTAHYQVVLPLIKQGAPVVIVMPSATFGPDDHSTVNDLMKLHMRGRLPILPGKETTFSHVYVDDVAEGHILAAEKGRIGEAYLLTGTVLSFSEFVKLWAKVSGRPAPVLEVSSALLRIWWPLFTLLERIFPMPALLSGEAVRVLGATWIASSEKAQRELGYCPRPVEEGLKLTFDWLKKQYNQSRR
ncbi:MAG TPA: NAD-dependent epimerase/dehydratase family protein, partial [Anaerolineales bacterium]|nr:NAD-dependent epimerase/dehydratase family protein [Anaerolineales bacterium]